MATDVSALGIKVTSTGVVKTTGELERFAKASNAARNAAKPINIKIASTGLAKALADIQKLDRALASIGGKTGAAQAISKIEIANNKAAISAQNLAAATARAEAAQNRAAASSGKVRAAVESEAAARARISQMVDRSIAQQNAEAAAVQRTGAVFNAAAGSKALAARQTKDMQQTTDMLNASLAREAAAAKATSASVSGLAAAQSRANTTIIMAGKGFRLTAHEGLNFSRQMADIGVTAAMGMNPLMIAIQQGPQLFDIMQQAGVRTGKSIGSVFAATARQYAPFIAGLTAVAAAAGVAAVAWNTWLGQVNDEKRAGLEAYAKSLGLTKDQIEAAGGAAITSADMIGGLWDATREALDLDAVFQSVEDWITDAFNNGVADAKKNLSELYAAIYVVQDILDYVGENGGKMLAEGIINGINAAIRAINDFGTIYGPDGKAFWTPNIAEVRNDYTGAGAAAASAFTDAITTNYEKRKKEAQDAMGGFFDNAIDGANKRAMDRLKAEAEERKKASDKLAERLERERKATESLIAGNYAVAAAYEEGSAAALYLEIRYAALAEATRKQANAEAYVAQQVRKAVSERVKSAAEMTAKLNDDTNAQLAINMAVASGAIAYEDASDQLARLKQAMELNTTIDLAEKFAKDARGADAARTVFAALTKEHQRAIAVERQWQALGSTINLEKQTALIRQETEAQLALGEARISALRGLSGEPLDQALARANSEYEKSRLVIEANAQEQDLLKRKMEGTTKEIIAANKAIDDEINALWDNVDAQKAQIDLAEKFEREARAAAMLNEQVSALVSSMTSLGGLGGNLGKIFSVLTSNNPTASLLGMGGIGTLAGLFTGGGNEAYLKMGDQMTRALEGVFGPKASGLANTLAGFIQGAGVGSIAAGVTGGSKTGGMIGGGLGQLAGQALAPMLGKLGSFAGPIGAIAGGILGGVIGGLVKSTPRASATVSIIAGEAMETAIKGNKAQLKKVAGGMADSVISGLLDIADQFGAELMGDARVSIGMRKKNYRVDPTGRGITKTSKGAIDFGEDQAAAIAYAMQVAIQQGVLDGLSDSLRRLIQGDGDLQTQLQKALSFQSVFDELFQRLDPQGFDLAQLDKWRAGVDKLFAEAGATAEELAKLEELTGLKRAEIMNRFGEDTLQREKDIRDKTIELLAAQGKTEEALAAGRAAELADMPEYLRAIQQQIYAAQDAAAEQERLAEAQRMAAEEAQKLADARRDLEIRIMELSGDTLGALASRREIEKAAADASLGPLYDRIYALEDEATATAKAAEEAQKLADQQKAIADEIGGLNRQWLQLIGDTATLRAMDLAVLQSDEARELQQRIWDYQDALDAAAQATAKAAEAEQARIKSIEDARNTLTQAYQRESGALQQTIDKFSGFASTISEFRRSLVVNENSAAGFAQLQQQFRSTARMAGMGDEGALGRFTGDAQKYLDAARGRSGSLSEYQTFVAEVARASATAQRGSIGMVNEAEQQLRLMTSQYEAIVGVQDQAVSFNDALATLIRLQSEDTPAVTEVLTQGFEALQIKADEQKSIDQEAIENDKAVSAAIMSRLVSIDGYLRTAHRGNGFNVVAEDALPVIGTVNIGTMPGVTFASTPTVTVGGTVTTTVSNTPSVTVSGGSIMVANTTVNAVPVDQI